MKPTRERAIAALNVVLDLCDQEIAATQSLDDPIDRATHALAKQIREAVTEELQR